MTFEIHKAIIEQYPNREIILIGANDEQIENLVDKFEDEYYFRGPFLGEL